MKRTMTHPIVIVREIRDDFDNDFLIAYAWMVITFGRLEGEVKRAIKNLAVSTNRKTNFAAGIAEAEAKHMVTAMCTHMLKLHGKKYGECEEGKLVGEWVRQATLYINERNRIVHGTLTTEDDGTPVVLHTRLDRKANAVTFNELTIRTEALKKLHDNVAELVQWLHVARQRWANPIIASSSDKY
jgi:hypothetical protein